MATADAVPYEERDQTEVPFIKPQPEPAHGSAAEDGDLSGAPAAAAGFAPDVAPQLKAVVQSLLHSIHNPVLYAVGAYSDEREFEMLPGIFKCKHVTVRTPKGFSDTQVFVCVLEPVPQTTDELLHVAFVYRGTEPYELRDITIDLGYTPTDIGWFKGRAHGGFVRAFNDSITATPGSPGSLGSCLKTLLEKVGRGCVDADGEARSPDRVLCAGHSLGGALATLAAAWAKSVQYKGAHVRCITIGSPRLGDKDFVDAFDTMINAQKPFVELKLAALHMDADYRRQVKKALDDGHISMRIVHALDVVPSVPFAAWEFAHVGNPVWLQRLVNNWGLDIVVWAGADRPLLSTGWIVDHFQWRYRAARDIAACNPILADPPGPPPEPPGWQKVAVYMLLLLQAVAQQVLWFVSLIPDRFKSSAIVWLMFAAVVVPATFIGALLSWTAFSCTLAFEALFPAVALIAPPVAAWILDCLSAAIKVLTKLAAQLGL